MPKGCTVCADPRSAEITKALLKNSGTINGIAERYGIVHTTLKRHRKNCMGLPPVRESKSKQGEKVAGTSALSGDGETERNGPDASRLKSEVWGIFQRSKSKGDDKTALAALQLLFKPAGLMQTDSSAEGAEEAQERLIERILQLSDEQIAALADASDNKRLPGEVAIEDVALPAGDAA